MDNPEFWVKLLYTYGPFALLVFFIVVVERRAHKVMNEAQPNTQALTKKIYCSVWIAIFFLVALALFEWFSNISGEHTIRGQIRNFKSPELVTSKDPMFMRTIYKRRGHWDYEWRLITKEKLPNGTPIQFTFSRKNDYGADIDTEHILRVSSDFYDKKVVIKHDRENDKLFLVGGGKEKELPGTLIEARSRKRDLNSFVGVAHADEPYSFKDLENQLNSNDPHIRIEARSNLANQGPKALKWIKNKLQEKGLNYRLQLGIIVALNKMEKNSLKALGLRAIDSILAASYHPDPILRMQSGKLIKKNRASIVDLIAAELKEDLRAAGAYFRIRILTLLSSAHYKAGNNSKANSILSKLSNLAKSNPHFSSGSIIRIAMTKRAVGDLKGSSKILAERVTRITKKKFIRDNEEAVNSLVEIGLAQFKIGDKNEANSTLSKALKIAKEDFSNRGNVALTAKIASAQALIGNIPEALKISSRKKSHPSMSSAFFDIAIAQAKSGNISGALQSARYIYSTSREIEALLKISEIQIENNKRNDARRTLATALKILGKYEYLRPTYFNKVSDLIIKTGDILLPLKSAKGENEIYFALKRYSSNESKVGNIAKAVKIARSVLNKKKLTRGAASSIYSRIATLQAKMGNNIGSLKSFSQALSLAQKEYKLDTNYFGFAKVAEAFAEIGNFKKSIDVSKKIFNRELRDETLSKIVISQVNADKYKDALETAQKIEEPGVKIPLMGSVWVKMGQKKGVHKIHRDFLESAVVMAMRANFGKGYLRSEIIEKLANFQLQIGDRSGSIHSMSIAANEALPLDHFKTEKLLSRFAMFQAKAGSLYQALKTARLIYGLDSPLVIARIANLVGESGK